LSGLLRVYFLIFWSIGQSGGGAVNHADGMPTPEIALRQAFFGFLAKVSINVIEPFQGEIAASLTVGAGGVRRDPAALELAQALGLADGFAAGSPRLSHLPEKGPKNQAEIPTPVTGMSPRILLREQMAGNEGLEEEFELVEGRSGHGAQPVDLVLEMAGPMREVGSFVHGQCLYCPIDMSASLFFMKRKKTSLSFPTDYRRLQEQLGRTGWIALGSVLERSLPGQGGPRYQWSRRVGKKTVTVALSAEQFAWLKEAIANQRKVWDLLIDMQQQTLKHMWENLPSTSRRKRLTKKTLGLN